MTDKQIRVPDIGEVETIELVELLVSVGERVEVDQALVVLESDKASVELPSPMSGIVLSIAAAVGEPVREGDVLMVIDSSSQALSETKRAEEDADTQGLPDSLAETTLATEPEKALSDQSASIGVPSDLRSTGLEVSIYIPDLGEIEQAEIIEVLCAVGDQVSPDDVLMLLESDKASMEIAATHSGRIVAVPLTIGSAVVGGELAVVMTESNRAEGTAQNHSVLGGRDDQNEPKAVANQSDNRRSNSTSLGSEAVEEALHQEAGAKTSAVASPVGLFSQPDPERVSGSAVEVHAGPAVRKLARELGVDLIAVKGSGPNTRILKEDVEQYVKARLKLPGNGSFSQNKALPDFSQFGEVVMEPLSKIRQVSAKHLQSSWQQIPHVTHFDEADITDLEAFRRELNENKSADSPKISPLAFFIKAVIQTLKQYPRFNASLDPNYAHWVVKQYYNIGIAVETPDGLVVPNIKSADRLSITELASKAADLAAAARQKKLTPQQLQGGSFTISSLGGIGGTGFTPIVNSPEVAILGVARTQTLPRYVDGILQPRQILPLSVSYDHRAIDGAEAARFLVEVSRQLTDIRWLAI